MTIIISMDFVIFDKRMEKRSYSNGPNGNTIEIIYLNYFNQDQIFISEFDYNESDYSVFEERKNKYSTVEYSYHYYY